MPDSIGAKIRNWFTLFKVSAGLCVGVAAFGLASPRSLAAIAEVVSGRIFKALDWLFMGAVTAFVLVALALAFGRTGRIRLGPPDSRPEFSTVSWLSMLFAAGMGAGLLFYGVAEPISHYNHPPFGEAATPAAARQAMTLTNFHWGLHAWGIYCIGALVLAYFGFCKRTNYLASAPIKHVFKGRWVAPTGRTADLVAIFAVAFGVAASLGLGVTQVVSGLGVVAGVHGSDGLTLGVLALVVVAAMISATTGLDKGIKWLSNINMGVAVTLMLFVLVVGPTGQIMRGFFTAIGDYVTGVVHLTLGLYPYRDVGGWFHSWTLSFLVWWIAWAPFVGIFVARISRGRTIREFVLGVMLTPTAFSILWFSVFGGTAFDDQINGSGEIARLVAEDTSLAIYALFQELPLSRLLDGTAIFLVFIFLITSVDSATFVLGMLTSGGTLNPPRSHKLSWGTMLGLLTAPMTLLGRLDAARSVMVTGVVPYSLILLLQTGGLWRSIRREPVAGADAERPEVSR